MAFRVTCQNGHLEVAQWVYSLGGVDHHTEDEGALQRACQNGHLETVQYLFDLGIPEQSVVDCLRWETTRETLQLYIAGKKTKSARTVTS